MFYHKLGILPKKRHIQFRTPDGGLYAEELMSTKGFSGIYTNAYRLHPPTRVHSLGQPTTIPLKAWEASVLRHHHLRLGSLERGEDFFTSRIPILFNHDVTLSVARPSSDMTYFYRNGSCDEIHFVHEGCGVLDTVLGEIPYKEGDYLVIPRGVTIQYHFADVPHRFFIIESTAPIQTPKRYRNEFGQLLEHSPFCERDIRPPHTLTPRDEKGAFEVMIKKGPVVARYHYDDHPFDVVGWDGFYYPYAFSIYDFEPITGRIHQPPPVHQVFETPHFVVCNFVPRLFDYHPESIPAPYNHSNVDSDEVLYYVDGHFMSRKGIERASLTLHPGGIPHGPHPGTVEKSIGAKETKEYAVMVDTFRPLFLTEEAAIFDDNMYVMSWTV